MAREIYFGRQGRFGDRGYEAQLNRASALSLVINALTVWNTRYLKAAAEELARRNHPIPEDAWTHLTPLLWEHIHLVGHYRFEEPVIRAQAPPFGGDRVSALGPTGQGPSADLKRSEALLREARAALRRLDTLMSDAQLAQDPVTPLVAEARSTLEQVVVQLARRRSTEERRLRGGSRKKTRGR